MERKQIWREEKLAAWTDCRLSGLSSHNKWSASLKGDSVQRRLPRSTGEKKRECGIPTEKRSPTDDGRSRAAQDVPGSDDSADTKKSRLQPLFTRIKAGARPGEEWIGRGGLETDKDYSRRSASLFTLQTAFSGAATNNLIREIGKGSRKTGHAYGFAVRAGSFPSIGS